MAPFECKVQYLDDTDPFNSTSFPEPSRPPTYTFQEHIQLCNQILGVHRLLRAPHNIEDVALQLSHNLAYLDLESTLEEQADELEGFRDSRKNTVILRTQLSVRVHNIITKLISATGRDLRRALFSLKQIFQDDKDLVHEFVTADGLGCLITVGTDADQNYQNYILRAIGQIMLYVDGMNGVIQHNDTIQWLYQLLSSKYRLVQKTSLKLLLVFVEYTESNSRLVWDAIQAVDAGRCTPNCKGIIDILNETESGTDEELLEYAMTLINKSSVDDTAHAFTVGLVEAINTAPFTELIQVVIRKLIHNAEPFTENGEESERGRDTVPRELDVLYATPDQGTFYDVTDALEEQNMESIIEKFQKRNTPNKNLIEQCNIYESSLKAEDGDEPTPGLSMTAGNIRQRRSNTDGHLRIDNKGRRKSKRHDKKSDQTSMPDLGVISNGPSSIDHPSEEQTLSKQMSTSSPELDAQARRRQRQLRRERMNNKLSPVNSSESTEGEEVNRNDRSSAHRRDAESSRSSRKGLENGVVPTSGRKELSPPLVQDIPRSPKLNMRERFDVEGGQPERRPLRERLAAMRNENKDSEETAPRRRIKQAERLQRKPSIGESGDSKRQLLRMFYGQSVEKSDAELAAEANASLQSPKDVGESISERKTNLARSTKIEEEDRKTEEMDQLKGTVQAQQNKLQPKPQPEAQAPEPAKPSGDKTGILSRVKSALTSTKTAAPSEPPPPQPAAPHRGLEPSRSSEDVELEQRILRTRPLRINEFDFTDLKAEDDEDAFGTPRFGPPRSATDGPPPPPPPPGFGSGVPPPPPPVPGGPPPPPPPPGGVPPPPPPALSGGKGLSIKKDKDRKFVRLFWQEVKNTPMMNGISKTIWANIEPTDVDTEKLAHLFENRSKAGTLKSADSEDKTKQKEISVLGLKRAQAINIVLTKLPPIRTIKQAILDMDTAVIDREGIEQQSAQSEWEKRGTPNSQKIIMMVPTEEEKTKIQEAQMQSPDTPLGHAEQFLVTLASINELRARLSLWAYRLDYDNNEREVAEGLCDLKVSIEEIKNSTTFKKILGTLLSIGNFLNNVKIKGFQLDYLAKVPEVKDTVHKQSLLYHLCHIVMEKFPESTDLYSEFGAVHRSSRCDFDNIGNILKKLDDNCRKSWEHLRLIAKHDSSSPIKARLTEFLADAGERIAILKVVHRRVLNRFTKLLLFLGMTARNAKESKPHEVCRTLSEFALEYRTLRNRALETKKKKENHRKRTKTRGKMIYNSEMGIGVEESHGTTTAVPLPDNSKNNATMDMTALQNALVGDKGKDGLTPKKNRVRSSRGPSPTPQSARPSPTPPGGMNNNDYDTDNQTDQMMDMLVKTSTEKRNRIRKNRARDSTSNRKSVRRTRTLKSGISPEEYQAFQQTTQINI